MFQVYKIGLLSYFCGGEEWFYCKLSLDSLCTFAFSKLLFTHVGGFRDGLSS